MKNLYDEDYYERGVETGVSCYSNYRWIPELTIPLAARMIEFLGITEEENILDYGCAKGYLVKAFRLLHRDAYGYDVSQYAICCAPGDVKKYVSSDLKGEYDWVISKDVFEHLSYDEIDEILLRLRGCSKNMFCVVPLGQNGKFVIPAYELDKTHVIREDLDWWRHTFERTGWKVLKAEYTVRHIKENWESWERGNGFFVLKRREGDR